MEKSSSEYALVLAMLDLFGIATEAGQFDDASTLMATIRLLRPDSPELDLAEAVLLIKRGQLHEAQRLCRGLESSPKHGSIAKVAAAACLLEVGDPEWQVLANEVEGNSDCLDARTIAAQLLRGPGAVARGESSELAATVEQNVQEAPKYLDAMNEVYFRA